MDLDKEELEVTKGINTSGVYIKGQEYVHFYISNYLLEKIIEIINSENYDSVKFHKIECLLKNHNKL